MNDIQITEPRHVIFERYATGVTALLTAITLVLTTIWGPAVLGIIQYRTSQSGIYQMMGQDWVNLLLMAPLLIVGGLLHMKKHSGGKYFLILTPITLIYTGLSYGVGQEWSSSSYGGNAEHYAWLFLIMMISGLILAMSSYSMFSPDDSPNFAGRGVKIYVSLMTLFLFFFASMWMSEMSEVMTTGGTASGTYASTPTLFWVVRYLDLGFTIPLGLLALYLLLTRPRKAYPMILLFFGFFITLGTAVNAMAIVQLLSGDPELAGAVAAGLVIFPILGILSYAGLFYLLKDKIVRLFKSSAESL
ncbi:MAG: hypothetical protein K9W43_03910 [Candidatus Thorarchaeota archaeon]|nr:hypothetical protein [Candidatus Thorarchaeota archaeon]